MPAAGVAYTDALADEICHRIANGESLSQICRDDFMPARQRVYEWLNENEAFADNYTRAISIRADRVFDEVLEIADDPANLTAEALNAARLKIDARKWVLGRMAPKKYGDKLELGGNVGLTVTLESDAEKL